MTEKDSRPSHAAFASVRLQQCVCNGAVRFTAQGAMLRRHADRPTLLGFGQLHHDLISVDFDFVSQSILSRGHADRFAAADVESGSVTWTRDFETGVIAVAECPTIVCANIVDAEKVITDSEQDDELLIDFDK